jgi:hypothetical protein
MAWIMLGIPCEANIQDMLHAGKVAGHASGTSCGTRIHQGNYPGILSGVATGENRR